MSLHSGCLGTSTRVVQPADPSPLRVFDRLRREVVLDNDRGVQGCEVDLVDLLIHAGLGLEDHASLVRGPQLRDVPDTLCVPFPEGHRYASPKGLVDLVRGDKRARGEAGGEVWREAGEPGGHENALEPALRVDEALGSVYENPALGIMAPSLWLTLP